MCNANYVILLFVSARFWHVVKVSSEGINDFCQKKKPSTSLCRALSHIIIYHQPTLPRSDQYSPQQ